MGPFTPEKPPSSQPQEARRGTPAAPLWVSALGEAVSLRAPWRAPGVAADRWPRRGSVWWHKHATAVTVPGALWGPKTP